MRTELVEMGVATQMLPGQLVSGDLHLVKPLRSKVLVAAVDGLGHGEEAALAARVAVTTLAQCDSESVLLMVRECHQALEKTRGVVMNLAVFDSHEGAITWMGIGNIEGILLREDKSTSPAHESVLLRGGVVGYNLPPLRAAVIPVARGDTLIFATDGVASGFAKDLPEDGNVQQLADHILHKHQKGTDDALVLVTRYLGNTS